jgi:hypothetical protein
MRSSRWLGVPPSLVREVVSEFLWARGGRRMTRGRRRDDGPSRVERLEDRRLLADATVRFLDDTYTTVEDVPVTSHQPEVGGAYGYGLAANQPAAAALVEGGLGRLRHASTGNSFVVNDAVPATADYDVVGTMQVFGTLGTSGGSRENTWGLLARWDAATATGYHYRYNSAAKTWQLYRNADGADNMSATRFSALGMRRSRACLTAMPATRAARSASAT